MWRTLLFPFCPNHDSFVFFRLMNCTTIYPFAKSRNQSSCTDSFQRPSTSKLLSNPRNSVLHPREGTVTASGGHLTSYLQYYNSGQSLSSFWTWVFESEFCHLLSIRSRTSYLISMRIDFLFMYSFLKNIFWASTTCYTGDRTEWKIQINLLFWALILEVGENL